MGELCTLSTTRLYLPKLLQNKKVLHILDNCSEGYILILA